MYERLAAQTLVPPWAPLLEELAMLGLIPGNHPSPAVAIADIAPEPEWRHLADAVRRHADDAPPAVAEDLQQWAELLEGIANLPPYRSG